MSILSQLGVNGGSSKKAWTREQIKQVFFYKMAGLSNADIAKEVDHPEHSVNYIFTVKCKTPELLQKHTGCTIEELKAEFAALEADRSAA